MSSLITLHPKIIHFPIAFLYVSVLFEILYIFSSAEVKKLFFKKASQWLFYLGFFCAVFAAASGLIAEDLIGHESAHHDEVHVHKYWMLATLGLWTVSALFSYLTRQNANMRKFLIIGQLLVMLLLTIGAKKGGKLVYEYGIGVNKEIIKTQPNDHHNHADEDHHHDD